ncbi:MAG: glycosyltransferase [Desulfosporosinus sp.]|nr:glycosyltransferase [Desulfosporosinus sp.]
MNIVFLVGSYYPYFSAVGTCCYNIAEEMAKQNKITVVCMKSRIEQSETEEYQGQAIIRVSHRWWDVRLKLGEKMKTSASIIKKCYNLLLNIVRAKEYLQIVLSTVSLNKGWVRSYRRALENIKDPIDVIIPLCFPMEAVAAGMEYKHMHKSVKIIPYLFDPFVESHTLHRAEWNKRLKRKNNMMIETYMLNISSKVFCVNQLQEHFIQYTHYLGNLIFNEHPLLIKIYKESSQIKVGKGNIHLTYAGVFDKKIRNPEYLLKFMLRTLPEIDAKLHLYSYGNCVNVVEKYSDESKGSITNHGFVPKEEANRAVYASDILVCVGNIDNLQVPSKIFEYMSTGKPIVHFYTADDDVNVKILKDYPLCLCLKQDKNLFMENRKKFIKFCQDNKGKTLDFSEVEKFYYYATPEFIAKQMMEIIDSGENPRK